MSPKSVTVSGFDRTLGTLSKRTPLILTLVLAFAGITYFLIGRGGEPDAVADTESGPDVGDDEAGRRASGDRDGRGVVAPATASGRVSRAADASAVAGAVVVLTPNDDEDADPVIARSDAGGAWSADGLSPGDYSVSATAPGLLRAVEPHVRLETGARRTGIDLQLEAGGNRLRGTVRDVMGGPVEAALVRVTPVDGVLSMRRLEGFSALTGEDGTYTVQVPDGRHRIGAWHPDYAAEQRVIEFKAGDREQDFSLTPMSVIEGVVLAEATGQGVPGAKVVWEREQMVSLGNGDRMSMPIEMGTVVADDAGRFRIRGLSPGTIGLSAVAPGLGSLQAIKVDLGIAEQKTGVEVLLGAAHSVRGRVVSQADTDHGISGASVSAMAPGTRFPGVDSDADGYFVLHGLLPGRYRLMVDAKGFAPKMPGDTVEVDGDVDDVVIELDPGLSVSGRVEPPEAAQVAVEFRPEDVETGAGMGMFMLQSANTTADADDGSFELRPVKPGKLTLVATAADGREGEVSIDVGPDGARDVVVTLEKRASVSGTVVDTKGAPVTDAVVSFKPRKSANVELVVNGRELGVDTAPTDERGNFTVTGLADGTYDVTVLDAQANPLAWGDLPAATAKKPRPHEVSGAADQSGVRLVVEARDGVIAGVVQTAEGEPAPEIWVTATMIPEPAAAPEPGEGEGESSRKTVMMVVSNSDGMASRSTPPVLTDDEGRFEIPGLRDGKYELVADAKGGGARGASKPVEPGADVVVTLEPMGAIEGKVTANGSAVEDYVVTLSGLAARSERVRDGSGKYAIDRLEPGEYDVKITSAGGSKTESVKVAAGETATLDIALESFVTVTGTVVDKEGQPIVGARVLVAEGDGQEIRLEMDGSEEDVRTDEAGKLRTRCAPGKRVLMIMDAESPKPIAIKPFVAEGGQRVDLGEIREREGGGGMMMGGPEDGPPGEEDVEIQPGG